MDLLITVDSEPPPFFMTYKYFPTVVSKLRKAIYWGSNLHASVYEANALPLTPQQTARKYYYVMKKGVDSESTIIIGPS